jgi:ABC-type antimicrobial peptide transport system ATPase subunit
VRRQEQILDELLRVGLDPEQALAQIHRLEAGDIWSG